MADATSAKLKFAGFRGRSSVSWGRAVLRDVTGTKGRTVGADAVGYRPALPPAVRGGHAVLIGPAADATAPLPEPLSGGLSTGKSYPQRKVQFLLDS